jgi:hypothetical protein
MRVANQARPEGRGQSRQGSIVETRAHAKPRTLIVESNERYDQSIKPEKRYARGGGGRLRNSVTVSDQRRAGIPAPKLEMWASPRSDRDDGQRKRYALRREPLRKGQR